MPSPPLPLPTNAPSDAERAAPARSSARPSARSRLPLAAAFGASLSAHAAALALVLRALAGPPTAPLPSGASEARTLEGDTFDVNIAVDTPTDLALGAQAGDPGPDAPAATTTATSPLEPDDTNIDVERPGPSDAPKDARTGPLDARAPRPPRAARHAAPSGLSAQSGPAADGAGASEARYGAVGERGAVDVAHAFTRAFPSAASTDPAWLEAPFGAAGRTVLTLEIDEGGKLVRATFSDGASPAFASSIRRTVALIRGRTFTAQSRVTKLRLRATVSRDAVRDRLHGDVFAVGASTTDAEWSAFFALAIGRRVDLRVGR